MWIGKLGIGFFFGSLHGGNIFVILENNKVKYLSVVLIFFNRNLIILNDLSVSKFSKETKIVFFIKTFNENIFYKKSFLFTAGTKSSKQKYRTGTKSSKQKYLRADSNDPFISGI